jgi:hypothetical protein
MSKKIHIYYHVCLIGDWLKIVQQQLHLLLVSGLFEKCDSLNVGVFYDSQEDVQALKEAINSYEQGTGDNKINFLYFRSNESWPDKFRYRWESATHAEFKKHADLTEHREYILYFHAKGVSRLGHAKEVPTRYWRYYLEYFNILKWKDCIKKLENGFESCGAEWREGRPLKKNTFSHYSGTFFWVSTDLIKKTPVKYFTPDYNPEAALSHVGHSNFSFYQTNKNLYRQIIKPKEYQK